MKRKMFLSFIMIISFFVINPMIASNSSGHPLVDIYVEGECEERVCGQGFVMGGTTYVPIRLVSESMGAVVVWNQQEKSVSIRSKQNDNPIHDLNESKIDSYDLDRQVLIEQIEFALSLNQIYLEQLGVAKELIDETGKVDMINALKENKMTNLRKINQLVLEQYSEFNERHKHKETENVKILNLISKLDKLTTSLNNATLALNRHANHSSHPEVEIYIYEKKAALDLVEAIINEIKD